MHSQSVFCGSLLAAVFAAACAGTPGAAPHDMSAEGHERAAETADAGAARHGSQYDPAASTTRTRCVGPSRDATPEPCWTTELNPSKEHLAEAERMRKAAADHRAASQALRDAEAAACGSLNEMDRDISPLQRPGSIAGVEELFVSNGSDKVPTTRQFAGAAITLRAVPGLTREYLQRLVRCHVARNSSMGHFMAEMATCPLAVKGATATVESASGGFVVGVRSDDSAAAAEIVKRAKTLAPGAGK